MLSAKCTREWKERLLRGKVTKVSDPPECCGRYHVFNLFTLEYEGPDGGKYGGVIKVRTHGHMVQDLISFHVGQLLALERVVPTFLMPLRQQEYEQLFGKLRREDRGDGERRAKQWEAMQKLFGWNGFLVAEVQGFYEADIIHVYDSPPCISAPSLTVEGILRKGKEDAEYDCERLLRESMAWYQQEEGLEEQLEIQAERVKKKALCMLATNKAHEIAKTLLFDYLLGISDRDHNCFLRARDGAMFLLDNDSGFVTPYWSSIEDGEMFFTKVVQRVQILQAAAAASQEDGQEAAAAAEKPTENDESESEATSAKERKKGTNMQQELVLSLDDCSFSHETIAQLRRTHKENQGGFGQLLRQRIFEAEPLLSRIMPLSFFSPTISAEPFLGLNLPSIMSTTSSSSGADLFRHLNDRVDRILAVYDFCALQFGASDWGYV
jgi:hypothetical protein